MKDPKIHSGIGIQIMIPGVAWIFQKNNDYTDAIPMEFFKVQNLACMQSLSSFKS